MANNSTRRSFLKQSSALAVGGALGSSTLGSCSLGQAGPELSSGIHPHGSDEIRFAVIGLGGRGSGAADQIMRCEARTRLVAVADAFDHRAQKSLTRLRKAHGEKVDVPKERLFLGLDAFKKAIDCDVDLVVIATPPGFKPQQFDYAVEKGRHIFMEKPVASDAPGVRRVLAANKIAKEKSLMVGIGLQRRHEARYIDCVRRLRDGEIGEINLLRVYWNGGGIWHRKRTAEQTEMMHQVHNWYHFIWASGDQICEQHIHNIDVGCWIKGGFPIEANGMGGGEMRMGGDRSKSQIFDHTFVEYTFADGTKMYSQGRHLKKSYTHVGEYAHGSKGVSHVSRWIQKHGGSQEQIRGKRGSGHQQEQRDLIAGLVAGNIYNEGDYGAMSTMTAILGREACYSGKLLRMDRLLEGGIDYAPGIDEFNFDSEPPVMPDADGLYPRPKPGVHSPFVV